METVLFTALPRTVGSTAAVLLLSGLVVGASGTPSQAGVALCDGQVPTITGTEGPERLNGTDGPDVIAALGGHDVVIGMGGGDVICGGDGDDEIYGWTGDDRFFGGAGRDFIASDEGDDLLVGGGDHDTLKSGDDDDVLRGGGGEDWLEGDTGSDLMVGGSDRDLAVYSRTHRGLVVDLRPGGGADDGNASDGLEGFRDELRGLEDVYGTPGRDMLTGNSKANTLLGEGGRDRILGGRGKDFIDVADFTGDPTVPAPDKVDCGPDRDTVRVNKGADRARNCEVTAPQE